MGAALAAAALAAGHEVVVVSGPVLIEYPAEVELVEVITTRDLLAACQKHFPNCDGAIAAAAPCDYQPAEIYQEKLAKTGQSLSLELIETPDVAASLGHSKRPDQWLVVFALETSDHRSRGQAKLLRKGGELIVVNGPAAMDSATTEVQVLDKTGTSLGQFGGTKVRVAKELIALIENAFSSSS